MYDWGSLNKEVIAEFRANGGRVARFGDSPVAILHTIGAKSGKLREVPLVVVRDGDEKLVFGTSAGAARHPGWYFNLKANPRITVEYGTERFAADVLELPERAARQKLHDQASAVPQFAEYVASAAPRVIPVFSIQRV